MRHDPHLAAAEVRLRQIEQSYLAARRELRELEEGLDALRVPRASYPRLHGQLAALVEKAKTLVDAARAEVAEAVANTKEQANG